MGEVVRPAEQVDDLIALDGAGARINRVRPDAGQIVGVDSRDVSLAVDSHARRDAVIAGVDIGGETLQPVGDELDGTAEHLGDDGDGHFIGIDVDLDAVAAADIAADDAHGR